MDARTIGDLPGLAAPESATSNEPSAVDAARGFRNQAVNENVNFRTDGIAEQARSGIKKLIVLAACWGFPAMWALWLIERGGLAHD